MNDVFAAYLADRARELYPTHFAEPKDRLRAVASAVRPLAPEVAAALERQNARYAPSPARDRHLAALRTGAAAVVTGQQVGLFLGPLYTLYKAASAVRTADALATETGAQVVPVFWLQTEDHDLPEIAGCNLPRDSREPLALRLAADASDRVSVAHCRLPEEVRDLLAQLRAALAGLPHAEAHLARLTEHYRPGASWAEAFGGVLAGLFADEGLVLVDPRDAVLSRAAAAVHRRAIEESDAISDALLRRSAVLAEAGFAATVRVRAGSPLSFLHPHAPTGERRRLLPAPGGFVEAGREAVHTRADLLAALSREPLSFSTSALLRPIVQDVLLPTAAYVGGPAEVAYFAQLAPLYDIFHLTMPLVVPRARFTVVDPGARRALARLGLEIEDLARGEDALLSASDGASGGAAVEARLDLARALLAPFDEGLRKVRARIEAAGPGMASAVEKTRATIETAIGRLAGRYESASLHRDTERVETVRRLKAMLRPADAPQERILGFPYFAARFGERAFIDAVLAAIDPFDPTPRALTAPDADDVAETVA